MGFWNISEKEMNFDYEEQKEWMTKYWWISIIVSVLYIGVVFQGPKIMQDRSAFTLRYCLFFWNSLLSLFSFVSVIRLAPELFFTAGIFGWRDSYCFHNDYYRDRSGYWAWLFHLSKVAELGDTVFLVLKKRPVLFMHWYHHAAVLVISWYCYIYGSPTVRWGVLMNVCVHSVMYAYFAVTTFQQLPRFIPMIITGMQLSQFALGLAVTFDVLLRTFLASREECGLPLKVCVIQVLLYASFLVLFAQFFRRRYC